MDKGIWHAGLRAYGQAHEGRGYPTSLAVALQNWPSLGFIGLGVWLAIVMRPSTDTSGATVMVAVLIPAICFLLALLAWAGQIIVVLATANRALTFGNDPKLGSDNPGTDERNAAETILCHLKALIQFLDGYSNEIAEDSNEPGQNIDDQGRGKGFRASQQRDVYDQSIQLPAGSSAHERLRRNTELLDYPRLHAELLASMDNLICARNCRPQLLRTTWKGALDDARAKANRLADYLEDRL